MSVLSGRFVLASRGNSASVDGVFVHKRNSYIYIRQEHERERESGSRAVSFFAISLNSAVGKYDLIRC